MGEQEECVKEKLEEEEAKGDEYDKEGNGASQGKGRRKEK